MAIYEVTRGIVLRETETKEADKILTVLTADRGRISMIARGARRKNSRLAASAQLLAYSELTFYRSGDWFLLTEASTLELFAGVRQDLVLLSLASYFAELTEAAAPQELPAAELLSLLLNALYALGELRKPPALVKAAFELRLLCLAGYAPLLEGCAVCGREEPEEPVLDACEGILLCKACRRKAAGTLPLEGRSLAAMRHAAYGEAKKLYAFSLDGASMQCFSAACEGFAAAQLERGFRTLDYYKSLQI